MTYLAVPYSHPDPKVREARFIAANRAAYRLMVRGDVVFSPISHSHPIEVESGSIGDHQFWAKQDDAFQDRATHVAVLTIDGWKESRGVQREIQIATETDIPIEYLDAKWAEPFRPPTPKTAYQIAGEITKGERKSDYGDAFDNHSRIAQIWSGILNRTVTPLQVNLCMIGLKLARQANRPKQDNFTDVIGYAKIADEDERFSA
jgi:hypothetical protein